MDPNSLYLQCMGEARCTGYFMVRRRSKLYKAELTKQHSRAASERLRYRAIVEGEKILHHYNHGEVSVCAKHIRVDSIVPEKRVVYQFHGCYWHGHKSHLNKQALSTQSRLTLMAERCTDTLRTTVYLELLQWYLQKGLVVTKVHLLVEYLPTQ